MLLPEAWKKKPCCRTHRVDLPRSGFHILSSHRLPSVVGWIKSRRPMSDSFVHLHLHTEFSLLDGDVDFCQSRRVEVIADVLKNTASAVFGGFKLLANI